VLALRSLWLHKLRSFLSVLGIIIGTVAVITLMAFGEGSMAGTRSKDIKRQGATNVIVRSIKPVDDASSQKRTMTITYGLTYADYDQFMILDSIVSSVAHAHVSAGNPLSTSHAERPHRRHHALRIKRSTRSRWSRGGFLIDDDDRPFMGGNDGKGPPRRRGDERDMRNVAVLGGRCR